MLRDSFDGYAAEILSGQNGNKNFGGPQMLAERSFYCNN
jgi:hypothetical protein